jgi:hypothetical protein
MTGYAPHKMLKPIKMKMLRNTLFGELRCNVVFVVHDHQIVQ